MRTLSLLGGLAVLSFVCATAQAQGLYHPLSGSSGRAASGGLAPPAQRASSFSSGSSAYASAKPGLSARAPSGSMGALNRHVASLAAAEFSDGAKEKFKESNPGMDLLSCRIRASGSCFAGVGLAKFDSYIAAGQGKSATYSADILQEGYATCGRKFDICREQHRQDVLRYCLESPKAANLYFNCERELKEDQCRAEQSLKTLLLDPNDKRSCLEKSKDHTKK